LLTCRLGGSLMRHKVVHSVRPPVWRDDVIANSQWQVVGCDVSCWYLLTMFVSLTQTVMSRDGDWHVRSAVSVCLSVVHQVVRCVRRRPGSEDGICSQVSAGSRGRSHSTLWHTSVNWLLDDFSHNETTLMAVTDNVVIVRCRVIKWRQNWFSWWYRCQALRCRMWRARCVRVVVHTRTPWYSSHSLSCVSHFETRRQTRYVLSC